MMSLFQQCSVLISVKSITDSNWRGSRMETTLTGEELTLTYEKNIYSFDCKSQIPCGWRKKGDLEIARKNHVSISVPSELLLQCK